jgi:transposase
MAQRRISILKENRIYDLYVRQGYHAETVARICNCSRWSIYIAIRRYRRRFLHDSKLRCGRAHSWLSDDQILDIRKRRAQGERLRTIAEDYEMSTSGIIGITKEHYYQFSEDGDEPLTNLRLVHSR